MKINARNQLTGEITAIRKGGVMCQIKLKASGGDMSSVMTLDSLDDLGIKVGDKVKVVVKSINVLLVKE